MPTKKKLKEVMDMTNYILRQIGNDPELHRIFSEALAEVKTKYNQKFISSD